MDESRAPGGGFDHHPISDDRIVGGAGRRVPEPARDFAGQFTERGDERREVARLPDDPARDEPGTGASLELRGRLSVPSVIFQFHEFLSPQLHVRDLDLPPVRDAQPQALGDVQEGAPTATMVLKVDNLQY